MIFFSIDWLLLGNVSGSILQGEFCGHGWKLAKIAFGLVSILYLDPYSPPLGGLEFLSPGVISNLAPPGVSLGILVPPQGFWHPLRGFGTPLCNREFSTPCKRILIIVI